MACHVCHNIIRSHICLVLEVYVSGLTEIPRELVIFSLLQGFVSKQQWILAGFGDKVENNVRNVEWKQEGHAVSLHIGDGIILHDRLKLRVSPACELTFIYPGVSTTHDSNKQVHAHYPEQNFVNDEEESHTNGHGAI